MRSAIFAAAAAIVFAATPATAQNDIPSPAFEYGFATVELGTPHVDAGPRRVVLSFTGAF
jgi:hypothetical protein